MDHWGEKKIWDAALHQVRIVVSTHAVLVQALEHAFVSLSQLALIVFDEAHHCMKKHPANTIMRDFYHPARRDKENPLLQSTYPRRNTVDERSISLPHILGLSASLVMKSDLKTLRWVAIPPR
ncbi:Dicer-like protein 2 [Elasticomyces elasticus]|nr:Dicer-like protein 2 [Elasticomyces elasticus]